MRVAVVGATGNIGTSLVEALGAVDAVEEIVGVARRAPTWRPAKTRWVAADITRDDLSAALRGVDAVFHLAWLIQPSHDLATLHRVNVGGSARVFAAAAAAGARFLLHTSSVGAYSPGPAGGERVDESWPTDGIETSSYSRHKAYVERLLDIVERDAPRLRVVRVRPVLVGKRAAAAHLRRLFVGPFLPNPLLGRLPVGPTVAGLRLQLMHGDDVAAAMCRALLVEDARGAYNLTNEPVLTARDLAEAVGAVPLPVPAPLARGVAALAWRLHLQPTPPGWLDLAMTAPLLEAGRVRRELGWEPVHDAHATLAEVVGGLRDRADGPTPPLRNATSGPARLRELRTGVGRRT